MTLNADEVQIYQDAASRLVDKEIFPRFDAASHDVPLPKSTMHELFRLLAQLGVLNARVPTAEGGSGLPHVLLGAVIERLPPVLGISLIGHESAVRRISLGASSEVVATYMQPLGAGDLIAATATTEPDVGSDPRGVRTRFEVHGDTIVIDGTKLWVTNGSVADVLVVVGRLFDNGSEGSLARVLVDMTASGIERREVPALGLRRGHLAEVVFDGVEVPRSNLLGDPGDAHATLTATWLGNRPCVGLVGVGIANRALSAALSYADARVQFGSKLSQFQLIQQKLAQMYRHAEAARLICYDVLRRLDEGEWPAKNASLSKWAGTEAGLECAHEAIQIHGGTGLAVETGIEELWRDARMLTIPDGTNEIQQLIIGRELTGVRAFRTTGTTSPRNSQPDVRT